MHKRYLFCLAAVMCTVSMSMGCSPSENDDPTTDENGSDHFVWSTHSPHTPPVERIVLQSNKGCQLDGDCLDGMFCYYGTCTWQCNEDTPCADGLKCSARGRCVDASKLRDANSDLEESKLADVTPLAMQVEFIQKPSETVLVPAGATEVEIVIQTTKKHIEFDKAKNPTGKIDYVLSPSTATTTIKDYTTTSGLKSVDPVIDSANVATYTLKLDLTSEGLNKATLGSAGEKVTARLMTSLGEFNIGFTPMKSPSGIYDGGVVAEQLAGSTLPIRMGIDVTMSESHSRELKDIDSIVLYLPSSKVDLFSPESPSEDGAVVWSKLKMLPQKANNCRTEICAIDSDTCCWAAEYSTNDFVMPGSKLTDKGQKINRSIRVEIHDMDLKNGIVSGFVRDTITGLYREIGDDGNPKWSAPTMEGDLILSRVEDLKMSATPSAEDASVKVYKDHVFSNVDTRNVNDSSDADPAYICTDADIVALMGDVSGCESITTVEGYKGAENAEACLTQAVTTILEDPNRISKVIEGLITRAEDSVEPVGGFNNIKEFLENCAKADGICKDRSEMRCAVDLLGRAYLEKKNPQDDPEIEAAKTAILGNWHQLLRESYLGRQYAAWNSDISVRESWLTTATAPAFIQSSSLEAINNDLLAKWEANVLDAHHNVLVNQFSQTSLEVLTRMDTSFDIRSKRDLVLMEYSQAWEGLSDTLALGSRRYNTLLTSTKDRLEKADKLQTYIFDLYYVGLIESAINLLNYPCKDTNGNDTGVCPDITNCGGKDDNGKTIVCNNSSLNATYGKNLYENVSNLKALNQSFDSLVYMRDAEVVTSTSLDPAANKDSVLANRKALAEKLVLEAGDLRNDVFDKRNAEKIDQATINSTLSNNLDALMTEMVALCGYPQTCNDSSTEKCYPMTDSLKCGFDIGSDAVGIGSLKGVKSAEIDTDKDGKITREEEAAYIQKVKTATIYSDVNDSEAAEAILAYRVAMADVDIAVADYTATLNKVELAKTTCDNYATKLHDWHKKRQDLMKQVKSNIDVINEHYDNITKAERDKLQADIDALQSSLNSSYAAYCCDPEQTNCTTNITASEIEDLKDDPCQGGWNKLASDHLESATERIYLIEDLQQVSMSFGFAGETALNLADAGASFYDGDTPFEQINAVAAGTIKTVGALAWAAAAGVQLGVDIAAASQEAKLEVSDRKYEFESEKMDRIQELKVQEAELEFAKSMAIYSDSCTSSTDVNLCRTINVCNCKNGPTYTNYTVFYSENHCPSKVEVSVDLSSGVEDTDTYNGKTVTGIRLPDNTLIELDNGVPVQAYVWAERENGIITENQYKVAGEAATGYTFTADTGCEAKTQNVTQGIDQWILTEQNAIDQLDEVNDTMRELFEISDTYERDLQDLEARRLEYLQLAEDLSVKAQQVEKALIAQLQAEKRYYSIVQKAKALKSQYDVANSRLQKLNNLYSTPASVFAYAASLEAVENKIDLAKERIYDYLSAVEYYAVRPFVDMRRATYLARSVEDLTKIVDNVQTLVDSCGGNTSTAVVELSAREKMGITTDYSDMTMGERFRYVMAKGNIPINSLTRYTVDSNVRDLIASGRDLRAGTFELKISEYANLAATCNAKIDNIAIQLVGENLIKEGEGEFVIPTMTLFYDGQTQLASCQPNIEDIVSVLGSKTSYGKYSTFVVTPTKISPTAGLNDYGNEDNHLAGKPLATTYTVLIDTTIGENAKINWDNVDDIRLKLTYTYQNLFSADSQCSTL